MVFTEPDGDGDHHLDDVMRNQDFKTIWKKSTMTTVLMSL